jgi:hypothetical protein
MVEQPQDGRVKRLRSAWSRRWPGTTQAAGMALGVVDLIVTRFKPNIGLMTFAAALIMFQKAVKAQTRRNQKREDDDGSNG